MDSENSFIGPQLPKNTSAIDAENTISSTESISETSTHPDKITHSIGPKLPSHMSSEKGASSNSEAEVCSLTETVKDDHDVYGPALPPHLKKNKVKSSVKKSKEKYSDEFSSDEESYVIGPFPAGSLQRFKHNQKQLELRASYLKRKMDKKKANDEKKAKRETWMLELPPEKAKNLGLGARSFRTREGPDLTDRSDWTDTPADRAKKELLGQDGADKKDFKKEMDIAANGERDKAMESMVNKCKSDDRQMSLLEMHQKKLKKKEKKKKNEKPERRPFDRNIDLQANKFDDAQKKSIFKKAQLLDSRFSQGQSKYL